MLKVMVDEVVYTLHSFVAVQHVVLAVLVDVNNKFVTKNVNGLKLIEGDNNGMGTDGVKRPDDTGTNGPARQTNEGSKGQVRSSQKTKW